MRFEAARLPYAWSIDALAGTLDRHLAGDDETPIETPWIADTLARLVRLQRTWVEELRGLAAIAARTTEPEELTDLARRARGAFSAAKRLERKKRVARLAEALDFETAAAD